jgi:hypothetical protein
MTQIFFSKIQNTVNPLTANLLTTDVGHSGGDR